MSDQVWRENLGILLKEFLQDFLHEYEIEVEDDEIRDMIDYCDFWIEESVIFENDAELF